MNINMSNDDDFKRSIARPDKNKCLIFTDIVYRIKLELEIL